ncbi:MAG: glycosyltransferase [Bacteroidales bacterium]
MITAEQKILLLADANSVHTFKLARSLVENNINVLIFSLDSDLHIDYSQLKNLQIEFAKQKAQGKMNKFGEIYKTGYILALSKLKSVIKTFKPDILHAHYASSYGLLGSLSGFHPYILSVWGSDVYDFPTKSFFHKMILKYNFRKADMIMSTSKAMADETKKYTNKDILVTPFGIDLNSFKPKEVKSIFSENDIVIGTIKTLEDIYGIDYLIKAFSLLVKANPDLPLKILIVGDGSQRTHLESLTDQLGIKDKTKFTGRIPYNKLPEYHNMISIFVALSKSESFGVAIVESSACGKPVVVSNVGGLPEVVQNDKTGFIVPAKNEQAAYEALEKLVKSEELRENMGRKGRKFVEENYNWGNNVRVIIQAYKSFNG